MYIIFAKAFLTGLILSVPIGPVNILCIRRTLLKGKWAGFVSGLGAATADALYAFAAVVGLSILINFVIREEAVLRWAGGIFFIALGVKTFSAPADFTAAANDEQSLYRSYVSALLITLANPLAVLSILAVFAFIRLTESGTDAASVTAAVLGVFLGSALWWLVLSNLVGLFQHKITPGKIRTVNRFSGLLMMLLGAVPILLAL
ncbi:MAG TPA: LysE family transporter [Selenomonadales bacterium]|nr:LysE family transporter [Selenomonadales bacterium]